MTTEEKEITKTEKICKEIHEEFEKFDREKDDMSKKEQHYDAIIELMGKLSVEERIKEKEEELIKKFIGEMRGKIVDLLKNEANFSQQERNLHERMKQLQESIERLKTLKPEMKKTNFQYHRAVGVAQDRVNLFEKEVKLEGATVSAIKHIEKKLEEILKHLEKNT